MPPLISHIYHAENVTPLYITNTINSRRSPFRALCKPRCQLHSAKKRVNFSLRRVAWTRSIRVHRARSFKKKAVTFLRSRSELIRPLLTFVFRQRSNRVTLISRFAGERSSRQGYPGRSTGTGLSVNYSNCRTRGIPLAASTAAIRECDRARFRPLALRIRVRELTRMSHVHATNDTKERTRHMSLRLRLASRSSRSSFSPGAGGASRPSRRSSRVLQSPSQFSSYAKLHSYVFRNRLVILRRVGP